MATAALLGNGSGDDKETEKKERLSAPSMLVFVCVSLVFSNCHSMSPLVVWF